MCIKNRSMCSNVQCTTWHVQSALRASPNLWNHSIMCICTSCHEHRTMYNVLQLMQRTTVTCIVHYKSKFMGPFHRLFMGQGVGCSGGDQHGTGPLWKYFEKKNKINANVKKYCFGRCSEGKWKLHEIPMNTFFIFTAYICFEVIFPIFNCKTAVCNFGRDACLPSF